MMRTMVRLIALLAVALVARGGFAEEPKQADPRIPITSYTLENGLQVILHQDRSVPVVYVSVWYHVGSGDETPGKSGFAHLFEHMMFQGSSHTGEDVHFPTLRRIGVTNVNGTTNTDRTNYYEEIPSNQLETALWLESDRMGYLLPVLTEKSLDNQREVVRNERRQNYDDVPYGKDRFALAAAIYPVGHPNRYLTIGLHEDIERASVADVKAFFETWYVPSNATLCIAGDFDLEETKRLVDKWFATFPRTTKPARRAVEAPVISQTKRVSVDDSFATLRRVHYAWVTPAFFAPGDAELDVVAQALGQQGSGRLYKILVIEKQLARSVAVGQASEGRSSVFHVMVDLRPDADQAEVERIIDEELEKVRKDGVTERELRRTVVSFEAGSVWQLESLAARAEQLQSYNHFVGTPDYVTRDLDRYRTTTLDKVRAAAERYLGKQQRVEVITVPVKKQEVK